MPSSGSFLRQLSGKEGWKSTSKRWVTANYTNRYGENDQEGNWKQQVEGLNSNSNMMYGENGGMVMMKRVMVVVDESSHSKHAMMWALTHVANKGDRLTLLHIVPPNSSINNRASSSECSPDSNSPYLASSLGSLCKACKPEVK